MKRLCFSFYNVNILQLNVATWGPICALVQCPVVVMHLLLTLLQTYMFQLGIF